MSENQHDAETILEKALDNEMISAQQLLELIRSRPSRVVLLDIRTEIEQRQGVIPGSMLFPCDHNLENLEDTSIFNRSFHQRFKPEGFDAGQRYVLICRTGPRTAIALATFLAHDLQACELLGGVTEWVNKGFELDPIGPLHPGAAAA